jgi:hypothetical protein
MNDRKTDETTPLAPHRPLTGPKNAGKPAGVSQAPPRWNPNGSDEPPTDQQPSRGGSSGRSTPPAKSTGSSPTGSDSGDSGSGGSGAGRTRPAQAPSASDGPPMQPGPPKRQPEMQPGPSVRGPEMSPGPSPRTTKTRPPGSPPVDSPTEAMPRVSAPTLQPSPPPHSRQRTQPEPAPVPGGRPTTRPRGRPRRARLRLVRVDPWSVMKIAFALSIALAIVTVVAVSIVWAVLGAAGVWDSINDSVAVVLSDNSSDFDIRDYVGMGRVVGLTMIVAAADVILITAIATLGAFLYNLAATMLGGLEITLAEDR